MCTIPVLRRICRECYSDPGAVYETLKRAGMDLVTVTDHDSIDAGEALGRYPDFFLSEEVTCLMPSGSTIHIGVYDINERQHIEIQARRNDLPRLLAYFREQDLLFDLKHPFSSLTGRRDPSDLKWFRYSFPTHEVMNGQIPPANNRLAKDFALMEGRAGVGGSDAHTLLSAGRTYTEVPYARNREEFIEGLKDGRGRAKGETGSYWKLTCEVLRIGQELFRDNPWTWPLAPLTAAIPLTTFANYLKELSFARAWRNAIQDSLPGRGVTGEFPGSTPVQEVKV